MRYSGAISDCGAICTPIAAPVGNLSDLMERLGLGAAGIALKADFKKEVEEYYADMDETSRRDIIKLALAVKSRRGIGMDDLCSLFGWTFSKVSRIVTTLECDGFISVDLLQHCSPRVAKS